MRTDLAYRALGLADAVHEIDIATLMKLTPEQRAEQMLARQALYDYFTVIDEMHRARGVSFETDTTAAGMNGLYVLALNLISNVDIAQGKLGHA
jgi:hypothetical protein